MTGDPDRRLSTPPSSPASWCLAASILTRHGTHTSAQSHGGESMVPWTEEKQPRQKEDVRKDIKNGVLE
jgi:hypothetical protein